MTVRRLLLHHPDMERSTWVNVVIGQLWERIANIMEVPSLLQTHDSSIANCVC